MILPASGSRFVFESSNIFAIVDGVQPLLLGQPFAIIHLNDQSTKVETKMGQKFRLVMKNGSEFQYTKVILPNVMYTKNGSETSAPIM